MTKQPRKPYLHPEKYREFGLTVGLCNCVQENAGIPEPSCEYCYGTGVSVYTHVEIPTPTNCPHWANDPIYVKGFRCALYRDTRKLPIPNNERCRICEQEIREKVLKSILAVVDDRVRLNDYASYIVLIETIKKENGGSLESLRQRNGEVRKDE